MKPPKTLGMIVAGLLTAMALTAAAPAMAESTAFCLQDENPCGNFNFVTHVHATSSEKAKVLTAAFTGECSVLFLGDGTSNLASPLEGKGNFTYSNCSSTCTIVEENGPAVAKFLRTSNETASVTVGLLIHLTCSGINCFYSGEVSGIAIGALSSLSANGEVSFKEAKLAREKGLFCPAEAKLDAVGIPLERVYIVN